MKLILVLMILLISPAFTQNKNEKDISDYVKLTLKNKSFITSSGDYDIVNSNLSLFVGNYDLREVLEAGGLKNLRKDVKYILSFDFDISLMPWILKDSTENELHNAVDRKLLNEITAKVNAEVAADPTFVLLPPSMQETIKEQLINDAISSVKEVYYKMVDDRLDHVAKETSFQTIAIVFGSIIKPSNNTWLGKRLENPAILFVKAGKFKIEHGPAINDLYESKLEEVRPVHSITQISSGSTTTTGITVGMDTEKDDIQYRIEATYFHNRVPFQSGRDYLLRVVKLNNEEYESNKDLGTLDSFLIRMLFQKRNSFDLYLSVGSRDGEATLSSGVFIKITDYDSISLDYSVGKNNIAEQAVSAFIIHRFKCTNKKLAIYAGVEFLEAYNRLSEINGVEEISVTDAWGPIGGISYDLKRKEDTFSVPSKSLSWFVNDFVKEAKFSAEITNTDFCDMDEEEQSVVVGFSFSF